jgi:hypothetical protein
MEEALKTLREIAEMAFDSSDEEFDLGNLGCSNRSSAFANLIVAAMQVSQLEDDLACKSICTAMSFLAGACQPEDHREVVFEAKADPSRRVN